jgi:hypothetical protein
MRIGSYFVFFENRGYFKKIIIIIIISKQVKTKTNTNYLPVRNVGYILQVTTLYFVVFHFAFVSLSVVYIHIFFFWVCFANFHFNLI